MQLHANAALGPAGRRRLVGPHRAGPLAQGRRGGPERRPGDGTSLVAPLGRGQRARAPIRRLPCRPLEPPPPLAPAACLAAQEAPILAARAATNLGPGRLAHIVRAGPLDDLQGACPSRALAAPPGPTAAHPPLRVGSAGRAHPHRHRPPGALWPTRAPHPRAGRRAVARSTTGPARSSCTSPLTITAATPTSSSTPTSERPPVQPSWSGALAHFAELGLGAAEAVMTDGALAYRRGDAFQRAMARAGARHILTPPYTPRWNGKAERFIQTMQGRVGLRPRVALIGRPGAGPLKLGQDLQSASAPQLPG